MICPYCGKDMLDGQFVGGRFGECNWRPEPRDGSLLAPALGLADSLFGEKADSAYCVGCRVLIARPTKTVAERFEKRYYKHTGRGETL